MFIKKNARKNGIFKIFCSIIDINKLMLVLLIYLFQ